MKRPNEDEEPVGRPNKILRILAQPQDRLSQLSDELLLRILSFVPITTLNVCQRISNRLHGIATDSQLWKAAYYNRFVRPRAAQIPGASSDHLSYSSKLSKWLDEAALVKRGQEMDWKRQYRLRHNWSRGKCAVSEIPVAEKPPVPPLLARMHNGLIFTVDSISGLRAWATKKNRVLIASAPLSTPNTDASPAPTSLAVDARETTTGGHTVIVGFKDGSFSIYALEMGDDKTFRHIYTRPSTSNSPIYALAYSAPYILTLTVDQLLSLYIYSAVKAGDPKSRLLHSLKSNVVRPPLSLSMRPTSTSVIASIAYALPTYLSGWTVGIQEMHLSFSGELVESRLATAANDHFHSLSGHLPASFPSTRSSSPSPDRPQHAVPLSGPVYTKPTSLSYTHPYLLVSHLDNTLTLYLVTSTSSSLSIGPGSRLWGHTSSVSGAHVGGKGKAVSVSRQGNELRVWELEGGLGSSATRKRLLAGELSIQVRPEKATPAVCLDTLSDAVSKGGSRLGLVLGHQIDDTSVTRGCVGFDEENVIVLQEKSQGTQALVVYDFT